MLEIHICALKNAVFWGVTWCIALTFRRNVDSSFRIDKGHGGNIFLLKTGNHVPDLSGIAFQRNAGLMGESQISN
jgi:hypothetical protein